MATVRVVPLNDGVAMRGNWQVKKDGARRSTHTTKSGAKRAAKRLQGPDDSLVIHRLDGTVIG